MTAKRPTRGIGAGATALKRPDGIPRPVSLVAALQAAEVDELLDGPSATALHTLALHEIATHPDNPRDGLGDLAELAASIREFGVLQPPVVIPMESFLSAWPQHREVVAGHSWVIVAGHRRHAAARLAGLGTIDVIVRADLATKEAAAAAFVVENVHRMALSPLEEAQAYALLADLGLGQRDIARRTGVSQSHISKRMSLLRLPQPAHDALAAGTLQVSEAVTLAGVDVDDQAEVWREAQDLDVPISTAANLVARRRKEDQLIEEVKSAAEAQGVEVIDAKARFGNTAHDHRLYDTEADAIRGAREAGTLLAEAKPNGLVYYSTEAQDRRAGTVSDEAPRREASRTRKAACAQLVAVAPETAEATQDIVRLTLRGALEHGNSIRLVHGWLREEIHPEIDDPHEWVRAVEAGPLKTRIWVAWALVVAWDEVSASAARGSWTAETAGHLERLTARTGYVPNPWEQEQLSKFAR